MMQITHFAQSMYSGEFCQFDYGTGNMERYNLSKPPCYDLKKIVVPVFLYHGNDDLLISQTVTLNFNSCGNQLSIIFSTGCQAT